MPILSNIRHERFCHAICQNKTAAEAYRLAGYKAATQHTAEANGHRLMRNDEIFRRVAELRAPIIAEMELTTTTILRRLAIIAHGDLGDVMVWGPNYVHAVPSDRLTREQRFMISEIKQLPDGSVVVKLRDPVPALKLLGNHMGMFSGECAAPPAGGNVSDNRPLIYVDAPPPETAEQWEARQRRRLEALGRETQPSE